MQTTPRSTLSFSEVRGHTVVLEAMPGSSREGLLKQLVAEAGTASNAHVFSADMNEAGPWTGLQQLLRAMLPRLRAEAPDLLERHAQELEHILPELDGQLTQGRISLTDSTPVTERVRSYPMDRAFRLLHGCVDLMVAWQQRIDSAPWVLAFDATDRAGALVTRFFAELSRRYADGDGLSLLLAVSPGQAGALRERVGEKRPVQHAVVELPHEAPAAVDPDQQGQEAQELEARIKDRTSAEMYMPRLISLWSRSRTPERALRWHCLALSLYNHHGYYEDALTFARPILEDLDFAIANNGRFSRWDIIAGLFNALVATGEPQKAHDLVFHEAYSKVTEPNDLVSICYSLSMMHARFLKKPDFALAEQFLERAQDAVKRCTLPEDDKHFLTVFNLNGLALIRHRQGRSDEAITLCREGFEHLQRHLHQERHRLHRSVLLYNIAQVNMSIRSYEDALLNYSAAIEMDPHYSEYFNERGSVFLRMNRMDEAVADYLHAIELSPPYQEVWTNLGQAWRRMQRWEDALTAYSKALELDPAQVLPRVGRAQAHEALGHLQEAIADYSVALTLDGQQPLVWANRASLHFEANQFPEAAADLDRAIALTPATADLYQNRALAREALGQWREAGEDYRQYLALASTAEDRGEVEARLVALDEQLRAA
ncbi:tetratricopeptide repeat protein [Corallococcus aberystwythensis]|uniref:Tetratricopeptide repeat protein n=1 Tax=Corallococcus aberystwythensis TaxID=2316722 RepID=A0A3A8R0Z7_9BACT|nr:tetratricopeptide repeat protein [Corallococcus aberystwythensis]RKH68964.1 tetratricopeptide repeat protein [Corallococcus aberystwythensis]